MSKRLLVCTVVGSRAKATVPAEWREKLEREQRNVEAFFRHLLMLRPDQRVVICEVKP